MMHRLEKILLSLILLIAVALPNGSAAPARAQTTATLKTRGLVTDTRGMPVGGVTVTVAPPAAGGGSTVTDTMGRWTSMHSPAASQVFSVAGQASAQTVLNQDREVRIVLPPGENLLANGAFDTDLSGWTADGSAGIEPFGHSGKAARLGANCPPPCLSSNEPFIETGQYYIDIALDSEENTHLLLNHKDYWLRDSSGGWHHPEQPLGLQGDQFKHKMIVDESDSLHLLISTQFGIAYLKKPKNSGWNVIEYARYYTEYQYTPVNIWMDVDSLGQVHVLHSMNINYEGTVFFYNRRNTAGKWSAPVRVMSDILSIAAAPDGGAYLFGLGKMQRISANGNVATTVPMDGCDVALAQSTSQGEVMALCSGTPTQYRILNAQGSWQTVQTFKDMTIWEAAFSRDGSVAFYTKNDYYDRILRVFMKSADAADAADAADTDEFFSFDVDTEQHAIQKDNLGLAVSPRTGLHLAMHGSNSGYYVSSQNDLRTTVSSLEQAVTVPDAGDGPTLSFLYQIQGPVQLLDSGFIVTITDADGVAAEVYSDQAVGLWKHGWVDLTPWAGQTVTLRFGYRQAAGEPLASLLLDEVSVGAYTSPIITALSPGALAEGPVDPFSVTVTGSGFLEGAVVEVKGQTFPATVISKSELTFQLPGGMAVGHYPFRVVNPGGAVSNYAALRVGQELFIPAILR